MKRFQFNKLIRNNLPAIMQKEGVILNSTTLSEDEYIEQLKQKLLEEVREVLDSDSTKELAIELADVLEVVHSLARACGLSFDLIEAERQKKRSINGTFDASTYVHYIEVEETNQRVIDYLANKKRSPYASEEGV